MQSGAEQSRPERVFVRVEDRPELVKATFPLARLIVRHQAVPETEGGILPKQDESLELSVPARAGWACPVIGPNPLRLHRFDYDEPMLAEWTKVVKSQSWDDAYVVFKHDEGAGSGPPAVDAFTRVFVASAAV